MSPEKKACIIGGVVALVLLGLMLPLKGRVTYKHDLGWLPNEEDPTVLAAYVEEEVEIEQVDQLYPLRVFVEKEGYNVYFFHEAKDGNAFATWLVRVPEPDEKLLKHEEKVIPHVGLQVIDTTVEDDTLYATTGFDGGGILAAFILSGIMGAIVAMFACMFYEVETDASWSKPTEE